MTTNLEQFGIFAGKDDAIKVLKAEMAQFFLQQDRRHPLRSAYLNKLWDKRDKIIADTLQTFFSAASAERVIIETAIAGQDEAKKIQAVLVGLLGMALVQSKVVDAAHVSDSLVDRKKVVHDIVDGLISEKFGHEGEIADSLRPLAKYYQAQYDSTRDAAVPKETASISSPRLASA